MSDDSNIFELNTSNASLTTGPKKSQYTQVVGKDVVSPNFDYTKNQKIAQPKPIKCGGANKCKLPAVVGIDSDTADRKHLCQIHYEKAKLTNPSVASSFFPIYDDPQENALLRAESAQEKQEGRVRDSNTIYKATGEHIPVRGPGRPVVPGRVDMRNRFGGFIEKPSPISLDTNVTQGETTSLLQGGLDQYEDLQKQADALLKTLDTSSVQGGRNSTPDHDSKLSVAHTALLHAINVGNGAPDIQAYHDHATKLGMTNPRDRDKYFAHAMALQAHRTKTAVTPKPTRSQILEQSIEDFARNSGPQPIDQFSDSSNMMIESEIPEAIKPGKQV